MEFLSSDASDAELRQQQDALNEVLEMLGIQAPVPSEIPDEVETAIKSHRDDRARAFSVVHPVMTHYTGDVKLYADPWLASRATREKLTAVEINVNSLFSKYSEKAAFGKEMKHAHFHLLQSHAFLNTGSYGATPRVVLDARAEWELLEMSDPHSFRATVLPFRLRQVQNRLAEFVGAHPADLQMMVNANTATSTVLKSLPWEVGDVLLLLSCDYDATKLAAQFASEHYGVVAVYMEVIMPLSDEEVVRSLRDYLTLRKRQKEPMPKLANFCHVTSKTGWIFPVKRMTDVCHSFGIPVVLDGAQVPGHIPLDVVDIGAEYYIGTCHKWMFCCQGVAFLVVAPKKQELIKPLAPTSGYEDSFASSFVSASTEDYSTVLSLLQAFDFVDRVCGGWTNIWEYNAQLAQQAARELSAMWWLDKAALECIQISQVVPRKDRPHEVNCMPIVPLPNSRGANDGQARRVMTYLLTRCNITAFILVEKFRDVNGDVCSMLACRITCQIHVSIDDVRALGKAVLDMTDSDQVDGREYVDDNIQVS